MSGLVRVGGQRWVANQYLVFAVAIGLGLVWQSSVAQNSRGEYLQPVISLWMEGDLCATSIRVGDHSVDAFSHQCDALVMDGRVTESYMFSHQGGPMHIDIVSDLQSNYDAMDNRKNADTRMAATGYVNERIDRGEPQNARIVVDQSAGSYTAQITHPRQPTSVGYKLSIYHGSITPNYSAVSNPRAMNIIQPGENIDFITDQANELNRQEGGLGFVKISNRGKPVETSAEEWSCVKDSASGLMWEVKTQNGPGTDADLHDVDHTYTWHSDGAAATGVGGVCLNAVSTDCDVQGFVDAVNSSNNGTGLCGYKDWRIPTLVELRGIVRHNIVSPAIDTVFFPSVSADFNTFFWSSSPNLSEHRNMWGVSFSFGYVSDGNKSLSRAVRLVRGANRFDQRALK